jgi:hypothetical protein
VQRPLAARAVGLQMHVGAVLHQDAHGLGRPARARDVERGVSAHAPQLPLVHVDDLRQVAKHVSYARP